MTTLPSEPAHTHQRRNSIDDQKSQFCERLSQYLKQSVFIARPRSPAHNEAVFEAVVCHENGSTT